MKGIGQEEQEASCYAKDIPSPKLPKSSAGAQDGIISAINFGANPSDPSHQNLTYCTEIPAAGG